MSEQAINELFYSVLMWAESKGASDLSKHPGLWVSKTEERDGVGPLDVRINGHLEEINGIPAISVSIGMDDYLPGLIGIFNPHGGILMRSENPKENEQGLIAHFKAQTATGSKP